MDLLFDQNAAPIIPFEANVEDTVFDMDMNPVAENHPQESQQGEGGLSINMWNYKKVERTILMTILLIKMLNYRKG